MAKYFNNDSDVSLPEFNSRNRDSEINYETTLDYERVRIEQRFKDMKSQIGELTSMGKTLTEKISSNNREECGSNVRNVMMSL